MSPDRPKVEKRAGFFPNPYETIPPLTTREAVEYTIRYAATFQPRHPDRSKPILVLHDGEDWINRFRLHVGDRHRLKIPTGVTLDGLTELSQKRWKLVFMSSVAATTDQRLPLEALQRWFSQPNTEPVVVLSPFPTPNEARDSIHAGAIWYAEIPWFTGYMELVLRTSLEMAKIARRKHRVGSLRYQLPTQSPA